MYKESGGENKWHYSYYIVILSQVHQVRFQNHTLEYKTVKLRVNIYRFWKVNLYITLVEQVQDSNNFGKITSRNLLCHSQKYQSSIKPSIVSTQEPRGVSWANQGSRRSSRSIIKLFFA